MLYDLLKVRKLVDEAADLAVRAQNGTASSALSSDSGLPGAALGLNTRGAGGNARLSPERKYRMREMAVQKLAQAYRLDEVAASVATMQSASSLESVASLVLLRAPNNSSAKYVHFFHEKIPSRMMAEYTPITPLNEVISLEPGHAAPYRTRALTRIFKEDFLGAAQDLTEAMTLCRLEQAKHSAGKNQLISMKTAREEAEKRKIWTRDWMQENRVLEEDQPRGLELQLLFQRGNQYLTLACRHVRSALDYFDKAQHHNGDSAGSKECHETSAPNGDGNFYSHALQVRETIRKFAKRALRDYTTFFSKLDYAHALDPDAHNGVFRREDFTRSIHNYDSDQTGRAVEGGPDMNSFASSSQALVRRQRSTEDHEHCPRNTWAIEPQITIHDISKLLSASPPSDLPPFPPQTSNALTHRSSAQCIEPSPPAHQEMITYHPLMPETLHSLLLTHCLLQTPPTTLHRLANNVARLARLADGYPFFLSARSPARADWAEILRKTGNWIGLAGTWDQMCKMAPSPEQEQQASSQRDPKSDASEMFFRKETPRADETDAEEKDRIHKEAVMEALGDERVVDDESFQKAVQAREKRAWQEMVPSPSPPSGKASPGLTPFSDGSADTSPGEPIGRGKPGAVAKDEDYLIGTERAEAIAKWVAEAPIAVEGFVGRPKRGKKKAKPKGPTLAASAVEEQSITTTNTTLDNCIGDLYTDEPV